MTLNKKHLTDEQYRITQQHGTEPAYSGVYWDKKDAGVYNCICCDTLFFLVKLNMIQVLVGPLFMNQFQIK